MIEAYEGTRGNGIMNIQQLSYLIRRTCKSLEGAIISIRFISGQTFNRHTFSHALIRSHLGSGVKVLDRSNLYYRLKI